jgi:hypothetical protein
LIRLCTGASLARVASQVTVSAREMRTHALEIQKVSTAEPDRFLSGWGGAPHHASAACFRNLYEGIGHTFVQLSALRFAGLIAAYSTHAASGK